MSLEDHIKAYKGFLAANETALQHVAMIARAPQISLQDIDALFKPIDDMVTDISSMNTVPSSPFYEESIRKDYLNFLCLTIDTIKELTKSRLCFAVSEREKTTISPAVREELLRYTQRWVASLNPKLEGEFAAGTVKVDELQTPHDCIRYMHRVGTELFYDPNGVQWGMYDSPGLFVRENGGFKLTLISLGMPPEQYFETNPFLQRLHEIMETKKFTSKKRETETIRCLGGTGVVSFQLPLGCHSATLQVKEEKDHYRMSFKFTDTTNNSTSKFRSDVTEQILQSLGYTVARDNNVQWIHECFDSLDACMNNFEELLRLSVSLYDLDVLNKDKVAFRENDVIAAYHAGVINLTRYVCEWKKGTYVECAEACHSYRGHESTKKLEKSIEHPERTQEMIRKKPLEHIVDSLKNSYTAAKKFWKETDPYIDNENRVYGSVSGVVIGGVVGFFIGLGYLLYKDISVNNIVSEENINPELYAPLSVCSLENTLENTITVSKK